MDPTFNEGSFAGINDLGNVKVFPGASFEQPVTTVRDRIGTVTLPPASSNRVSGTPVQVILHHQHHQQQQQPQLMMRTSRDERAVSPRCFSFSSGISEVVSPQSQFNRIVLPVNQPPVSGGGNNCGQFGQQVCESTQRYDSGVNEDEASRTEWTLQESSIRQTSGEPGPYPHGRPFITSPHSVPPVPTAASTRVNGTASRSIQLPMRMQTTDDGSVVAQQAFLREDDSFNTTIERRLIRRKRIPQSPTVVHRNATVQNAQRNTLYSPAGYARSPLENGTASRPLEPPKTTPPHHTIPVESTGGSSEPVNVAVPVNFRNSMQLSHTPNGYDVSRRWTTRFHGTPNEMGRSGIPPRTFSQSNINQYSNTLRNQWTSENNLRSGTLPKQPPMYGTYSAHQENLRRQDLLNQQTEEKLAKPPIRPALQLRRLTNLRTSRRMSESGVGRVYQETVSLQPIGRGIQNLEGSSCVATLPRAGSHTGDDTDRVSVGSKYSLEYNSLRPPGRTTLVSPPVVPRTLVSVQSNHTQQQQPQQQQQQQQQQLDRPTHLFSSKTKLRRYHSSAVPASRNSANCRLSSVGAENRGQYYSGTQSPVISRAPGGRMVSEHRSRVVQNEWHNANGLGSSMGSLTPVQHQPNHLGVSQVDHQTTDLSNYWFRPHISREEATRALINKEPGHFIIRQSKSQANSYALVIRVPLTPGTTEQVRTFLLNRVKGGEAVHLQGFESEPIFPSLSSFVHDHTIHQGALPVPLKLPIRDAFSSGYLAGAGSDFACDVLYLGGVDVFPLKGESAVRRAVEQLLAQANNPQKGLKKMCEATVLCDNTKGITITDKHSTRFTKKRIPANKIIHCSYDPEERVFNTFELKNRGIFDSLIFAVVVKTSRFTWTEHVVYVMCQLEANQPSSKLINFINQNYIVQHRF